EEIFITVIERHESLRTTFELIEGKTIQKIHGEIPFNIEYSPVKEKEHAGQIIAGFIRPFDLSSLPLLRAAIINLCDEQYILLLDMHHIITDGFSHNIMMTEFKTLLEGKELPRVNRQYKDYSQWLNEKIETPQMKKQEEFWLKELTGMTPQLQLPADFPEPTEPCTEGSSVKFEIEEEQRTALEKLAVQEGGTLFMALLAVYNVFLSKLCHQEEIVVGTTTAGRNHAELEGIIGLFINNLALRNYPEKNKTFTQFLKQVVNNALRIFENQDYPIDNLVEKITGQLDLNRPDPLFDTMFALQELGSAKDKNHEKEIVTEIPGIGMTFKETARFDLSLDSKDGGKRFFTFGYRTSRFKKETIEKFVIYFKEIIAAVIRQPGQKISAINGFGT
ncbi:MAG: non-ribosomal peptide synthetase, partial [bacterium]|nr:non-ribosomal peptide synthetase [bacterium]